MPERKKKVKTAWVGPVPEVMDIATLSQYLGLGQSKIYALIREKKIPASKIGRQYRFSHAAIEAWLKSKLITEK